MPRKLLSPPSTEAVSAGDGCLFGFLLPPLAVLLVGGLMAFFMLRLPIQTAASEQATGVEENTPGPHRPGDGNLSPVFTPEVDYWAAAIRRWADARNMDPNLVATVMQIESCGDPKALSRSGAMGLFQVMPYHFASADNPFHPDTNALRGLDYLQRSLEASGGDPRLAFAGYNGGIGVIGRSESTWADETIRYAYWGSGIYAEASSPEEESLRLQEWLQAGGASLCRQAAERLGLER